jgi:hypothetical protein
MRERGFLAALRFYRAQFRAVFLLSLAFYAAIYALVALVVAEFGVLGVVAAAVYIVVPSIFWQQAPLARLMDDARSNRPHTGIRRTFETLYPRAGSITGATALATLGHSAGFYLFLIPGLFLAARWALIVPAVVWSLAYGFVVGGGPWFGGALVILLLALLTPPIPLMRILSYHDLAVSSPT